MVVKVSITPHVQVGLIHVERLIELTAERGNEDLVYFEFHDDVWKPPTLSALYAVALATGSEPGLGDTGRGNGRGNHCLLRRECGLNDGRDLGTLGNGETFCP